MATEASARWRAAIGVAGGVAVLAVAGGFLYQANTADAGDPQDPKDLLECADNSDYVAGAPPLYIADVKTDVTPDEIADQYVAEHSLLQRADDGVLNQHKVYESSDRVDIALRTSDGRTIAVVSTENSNGWKRAGSIECEKW